MPPASTSPSMLPTPLTRKATASAAVASPLAPRAVRESCAVSAPTPVNATPTPAIAAPAANDPATGCPPAIIARPSSGASTRFAPSATRTAAVRLAAGPTTPAPMSSARPVSSFCRVCRTTQSTLMTAARTAKVT